MFNLLDLVGASSQAVEVKNEETFLPKTDGYFTSRLGLIATLLGLPTNSTSEQIANALLENPQVDLTENLLSAISSFPVKNATQIQTVMRQSTSTVKEADGKTVVKDAQGNPLKTTTTKASRCVLASTDSRLSLNDDKTVIMMFDEKSGEFRPMQLSGEPIAFSFEASLKPIKALVAASTQRNVSANSEDDSDDSETETDTTENNETSTVGA